jgi:hypothetical protein
MENQLGVDYGEKQAHVILKGMGLRHANLSQGLPPPGGRRGGLKKRLRDALGGLSGRDFATGFQDESSPQIAANNVRLWSPKNSVAAKNTNKLRTNLFGFYPLNGNPVIEVHMSSEKWGMAAFMSSIRSANGDGPIAIIPDNNRPVMRGR